MKRLISGQKAIIFSVVTLLLAACSSGGSDRADNGGGEPVAHYTITTTSTVGGSVSPASATVDEGNSASFAITPTSGYRIDTASGCGGRLSGSTFIVDSATADCVINIHFVEDDGLTAPGAPTLSLKVESIKTFRFSWRDVAAESEYQLLENSDGASGYTPVATLGADTTAYGHQVLLPARVNARYILQACNSAGCTDSAAVFVSGHLAQAVGYFKSAVGGDNRAGWSVALSADGTTLSMGAPGDSSPATGINGDYTPPSTTAPSSGAVYIFTLNDGRWSQQAYIKSSNAEQSDEFGVSVALSSDGNTLAVGAIGESSAATGINGNQQSNVAPLSGAVYLFTRTGEQWSQQAYIKASNTQSEDRFGHAVTLAANGNTLAVGAYPRNTVYMFTRSGSVWSQQALLRGANTEINDSFGHSVSLSSDGSTLAVGAQTESSSATGVNGAGNNNNASGSGAVYVFSREGSTWNQQAYIKASNTQIDALFGWSLALADDGNTLAVGALQESSSATGIGGNASNTSAPFSGAAYVFSRSGTTWQQQAYVKASNTTESNFFGHSVALNGDGNTLAVGARSEASSAIGINGGQQDTSAAGAGAVYLFTRRSNEWSQHAYIKASNTTEGDMFGWSVALADDGETLAVGARLEESTATGVNGALSPSAPVNSGAVYLY